MRNQARRRHRPPPLSAAGLIVFVFALVLGPTAVALGADRSVSLRNASYSPHTIQVDAGDNVVWTNEDTGTQHSVTAHAGQAESFDSSPDCPGICLHEGDSFSYQFTKPGTYTYYCRIHGDPSNRFCGGMCGEVIVRRAPTPPPTPRATVAVVRTSDTTSGIARTTSSPQPSVSPTPSALPTPTATGTPAPEAAPTSDKPSHGGAVTGIVISGVILDAAAVGFVVHRRRLARRARESSP